MRNFIFLLVALSAAVGSAAADPIRLHPENPRYFSWRGKPTVLITSAEHYGAVVNADFDYAKYLAALKRDGLNYTRIFSGAYVEPPQAFGIRSNTLAPAENRLLVPWKRSQAPGYAGGGSKFDLEQWDDAYFARLHDFLTQAEAHGVAVELTIFCSTYAERNWKFSSLHPTNNVNGVEIADWKAAHTLENGNLLPFQERLARKLARELNHHDNLFFEIQNEPHADLPATMLLLNPYDKASSRSWEKRADATTPASLVWQRRIAACLVDEESRLPNRHLIAQNVGMFKFSIPEVDPNVSILNFHHALPESARWNQGWNRVIGFDETGSLGKEDTPYRKAAWNFVLAGGALYNNLDFSFTVGSEDGQGQNDAPGGGSATLRKQLKTLKDYMESFQFVRMSPDETVVRHAPGAVCRTLAEAGRQYAIYLDGRGPCELSLAIPKGSYRAEWIDTGTGKVVGDSLVTASGNTVTLTSPAFADDIALRIVAAP